MAGSGLTSAHSAHPDPLRVACPVCHQPAGAPCKNLARPGARVEMATAPVTYAHARRFRAAERRAATDAHILRSRAEEETTGRAGPFGAPLVDGITDDRPRGGL